MTSSERSKFVSILAWFVIIMNGLSVLSSLIGLAQTFAAPNAADDQLKQMLASAQLPDWFVWIVEHRVSVTLISLFLGVVILAAAIEFLWRKEWARKFMIGMIAFWTALCWLGVPLMQSVLDTMFEGLRAGMSEEVQAQLDSSVSVFLNVAILANLIFTAMHGWIIWKLCRPEIRREFGESLTQPVR